jgi:uncharacterized Zn finger protein (UPF0148 family)
MEAKTKDPYKSIKVTDRAYELLKKASTATGLKISTVVERTPRCPACGGLLVEWAGVVVCASCGRRYRLVEA